MADLRPPVSVVGSCTRFSSSQAGPCSLAQCLCDSPSDLSKSCTGTSWEYGPSVDWAGVVVERLTQLTLQDYMSTNIWQPLDIKDMTFFLSTRPDMQARVAHMTRRVSSEDPKEKKEELVYAPVQPALDPDVEDCLGGQGIFTTPRELFKVIRAVLLARRSWASDTSPIARAQLLRRSTAESMFRPQLGQAGREALQRVAEIPALNRIMGDMPVSTAKDWGLGGLLVMDDLPGWRGKGTLTWGGSPNLTWVSPKSAHGRGIRYSPAKLGLLPSRRRAVSDSLTD